MTLRNKRLIIIVIIIMLLVLGVLLFPFFWTLQVKREIAATLQKNHGDNYAILGFHVNGDDAKENFQFNMYERLYEYGKYVYDHEPNEKFNVSHHCALLVTDNRYIYFYYWSIRDNELILYAKKPIDDFPAPGVPIFEAGDIKTKFGMRFKMHVKDRDVSWYF